MANNAALEYIPIILFPQMNDQHLPPEIPTESHHLPYGYTTGALHFQFEKKRQQVTVTTVDRLLGLIPMIILFLIVLFELYIYFYWHLIPLLEKNEGLRLNFWEGYDRGAWKYIFHLLSIILHAIILFVSTYRTMFTPPGHVPEDLKLEVDQVHGNKYHVMISEILLRKMKKIGNMERKKTLFPRFCRNCLKVKPDRSHHCSICNTCVLKMDHHCPYINNCVGNENYKYFMNLVISGTIASLQLTTTMWEGVLLAWDNSNYSIPYQVTFGIAYLGNVILSVVLVAFLCFHFYLISNATTTIEFREKLSVKFDVSPYHKGRWNNFLTIFGKNPLIWFLPISNNYLEPHMNSEAMSFLSSEQEK